MRPERFARLGWAARWVHALRGAALALTLSVAACGGGDSAQGPDLGAAASTPVAVGAHERALAMASLKRMRAVHATGNWGGNTQGFAQPLLDQAQSLSATSVQVATNRSSFVDAQGVSHTNDLAIVTLTGLQFGNGLQLPKAAFWVYADVATGAKGLQFRPSLESNLAGINGFVGDVNVAIPSGSETPWLGDVNSLGGDARALVLAVIAHAPELLANANVSVSNGAVFGDKASLTAAMTRLRTALDFDAIYFGWLRSMNVEWIGISVAMHYDSVSQPQIALHTCPGSTFIKDSGGNWTACTFPDADLTSFIQRAKARGFRIYLTLAFETSANIDAATSPACHTAAYKPSRWWLGLPTLPAGSDPANCIAVSDWWWDPGHPSHTSKVAQFWTSYQQIAVKYATLAQSLGVELFSLGTETDNLFRSRPGTGVYTNDFSTPLKAMVSAVRKVYSGLLTYDQNANALLYPDAAGGINAVQSLWGDLGLDVLGLSAYFPLVSSEPNRLMSVAELETAWQSIFSNHLQPLRTRYPNLPLVFTEVGYTDHVNAPAAPATGEGSAEPAYDAAHPTVGMQQQANIFQALFNVNARNGDLLSGAFFWGNDYTPFNDWHCSQIGFGADCRPAKTVLANTYAGWKAQDLAAGLGYTPVSGWYWNPAESGRGYFVELLNGRYFVASFLYTATGAPLWYAVGPGALRGPSITDTLLAYSGGQTLTGSYQPPLSSVASGAFNLSFSDATHASLSWPGGLVPLSRYEISPGSLSAATPAFQPETGWWWNAAESGRGFAIEVQGDAYFIAGFMYDSTGAPAWYYAGGKMAAPNRISGTWQRCTGGQAMGASYQSANCTALATGSLGISFSTTRTARLSLPDGRAIDLTRYSF